MLFLALLGKRDGPATRQAILDAILKDPGINKRQLSQRLRVNWGTVAYHLRLLQAKGLAREERVSGRGILCFPGSTTQRQMRWLSTMRDPKARTLLAAIRAGEQVGPADLCRRTGFTEDILARLLEQLVAGDILAKRGDLRPKYLRHPGLPPGAYEGLLAEGEPTVPGRGNEAMLKS